jgi:hypothetical protein
MYYDHISLPIVEDGNPVADQSQEGAGRGNVQQGQSHRPYQGSFCLIQWAFRIVH